MDFLQGVLSEKVINQGYELAESWIEERIGDELTIDKTGWSKELKVFFIND